jgi:hypothetical protein
MFELFFASAVVALILLLHILILILFFMLLYIKVVSFQFYMMKMTFSSKPHIAIAYNATNANPNSLLALTPKDTQLVVQAGFQGMLARLQNAKPCGSCSRR